RFKIKIERGSIATDWTPAPEDIKENDNHPLIDKINLLLSEPLRSVGDVKDRLFRDSDGLWKIERNVGEFIVKGNDIKLISIGAENNVITTKLIDNIGKDYSVPFQSSHYKKMTAPPNSWHKTSNIGTGTVTNNSTMWLSVDKQTIDTVEKAKTWFDEEASKGTPVVTNYQLETPIIKTLSEELQDKLNNLRSFQDSNYVYTVNSTNGLEPNLHGVFKSKAWHYKNEIEPRFNKFVSTSRNKRKKEYSISLAKPNQQTIASISEAYGANYSIKLGNINEATFNVPYFIDKLDKRVKNENIELIKEKMYTKISYNNNDEWMVIDTIEDVGSGDEKYMTVTAFTDR